LTELFQKRGTFTKKLITTELTLSRGVIPSNDIIVLVWRKL